MSSAQTRVPHGPPDPAIIRDPVHGYLVLASHERIVVDDPITQRLRRVTQTGLAELVYPEARSSRFIHSVGTMHLASRFLIATLENASENTLKNFFEQIRNVDFLRGFRVTEDELQELLAKRGVLSALGAVRLSFHQTGFREKQEEYRHIVAVIEAGLRLAALFHDLGHLPFSHDFEYALRDYEASQKLSGQPVSPELARMLKTPPHEEIGHRLAPLVFTRLLKQCSPPVRTAFDVAQKILAVPKFDPRKRARANVFEWLHSLIDGEIDSDRADYLLRDGRALGLDFAHYDIERLIGNLVLEYDKEFGFITVVNELGLTALESFCLSRSRSHQVLVRHHKVAQAAALLRYASVNALKTEEGQKLISALESLALIDPEKADVPESKARKLLEGFAPFDDTWWLRVLRQLRETAVDDELLRSALDVVLERKREQFCSLWKRKGELEESDVAALNKKLDNNWLNERKKIDFAERRKELVRRGVLVIEHKFTPFEVRQDSNESTMVVKTGRGLEPASRVSPIIRSLMSAWLEDIHLHAIAKFSSKVTVADVMQVIIGKGYKKESKAAIRSSERHRVRA